jgi:hypothetical protein
LNGLAEYFVKEGNRYKIYNCDKRILLKHPLSSLCISIADISSNTTLSDPTSLISLELQWKMDGFGRHISKPFQDFSRFWSTSEVLKTPEAWRSFILGTLTCGPYQASQFLLDFSLNKNDHFFERQTHIQIETKDCNLPYLVHEFQKMKYKVD